MVFNKPVTELTKEDIDDLVENEVLEDRALDYKAELPDGKDASKKDFAADVAAFANAGGGFFIFGIPEKKDADGKNTGRPAAAEGLAGVNPDEEMRRLNQVIQSSIDPRLPYYEWKVIEGFPKGPIILLHIGRSWSAPHMVKTGDSRFYTRNGVQKQSMDVREIRSAFLLSESAGTQIRRFRDERLGRIIGDETPVMLEGPRRLVLHVIPFSSVSLNAHMDLKPWEKALLPPIGGSVTNFRHNFDGFLTWIAGRANRQHSYLQVFRTGALETVATLETAQAEEGLFEFYPNHIEDGILDRLPKYIAQLRSSGIEAPLVILVSLLNVKGATVHVSRRSFRGVFPVDRDTLLFPEALLEEYPEDLSLAIPKLLRPAFDALWQACGVPQCPNYDQEGNRRDHDR
ncbi:AlbA family DNA-binding domain-containing protein [Sorangium sp. So ce1097]|uniref:AlbA family DNA-binding domain-containing protein n=1 Tax=Sorangium sp. So ce1097 TaxID=3133330 RepID=UPI003F5EA09A